MGFYATDTRPAVEDLPPKNRVMGSRRSAATRARFAAPEPVDLHQETRDTSTKTVSGLVCWLSRDPMGEWGARNLYGFVNNAPINELDPLGQLSLSDLKKLQDAMKAFKDCHDKMVAANKTAREWWNGVATKKYSCCVNGKTVPIEDFPGVLTGDPQSKHGVLHCALGVDARANGVSESCILAANVLWEFKEFVDPHYWEWLPWKKGSWGWLKDTMSDMDEVFNAYFNVKTKEGCIPSQCTKTK